MTIGTETLKQREDEINCGPGLKRDKLEHTVNNLK